jgi:hypothetical protein
MLTRLVPQTDKAAGAMEDLGLKFTDAQGQFLPLTEIAQQLQDSFKGLSDAEKTTALNEIFGSDAARAASVLAKEGAAGLQTYIDATLDVGAASEAANARMKGTAGAVEELGGAWETLQLRIGKGLAPAVEWASEKLGGLMDFLGRNINTVMIVVGVVGALAAGILALNAAFIVASAATNAWAVITGVARGVMVVATAAQWAFNAAMSANPIGLVVAGIAALVAGLVWFFTKTELGQKIIKNVWAGIKSAIGGVVDWFQGSALPALQTAWDAIVTAAGVVWDVMKDVWGGIVKAAQGAWTVLKIIYVAAATAFTLWWQGMTWAWNTFGKPIWDAIVTAANWVGDQLGIAFDWMADKFAIFGGKVQGFYLKWIKPTWDAIVNAFRSAWSWIDTNVIKPFQLGLRLMGLVVRYLWLRYVVPAFNGIKNALGSAWNWIKRTIFDAWNRALTALGRAWQWLNTKVIQPAWRGIRTAASSAWNWIRSNVFTPFGRAIDAIGKAFRKVGDVIGKAWGKIKEAAAKPVNFVIETVYMKGIKGTWDKIAGSVGLDLKLPTVNPIRFANGSEDHRAQIARPGAMRLWAEPETGGEAYIPLAKSKRGRSTAILGAVARKFGYSLNKYADGGITGAIGDIGKKVLDFFADPGSLFKGALDKLKGFGGGAVGKIAGALPGKIIDAIIDKAKSFGGGGQDVALSGGGRFAGGPVMGWQNMWNIVKNAFPGATLNSAYRPGAITAVGTKSFHGQGRAIDVTPSMAIFNWLAKTFPNSSELIYSPAGRRQLYMGRQTMFGEPTRGDHWDHVHWAMANGGMLFDQGGMMKHNTVGVNKSGKAEAVLTNRETKAYQAVARNMATMAAGTVASNTYRADGGRKRMTLVVSGREFDAYVADIAEDVYDAEKGFERRTGRMR